MGGCATIPPGKGRYGRRHGLPFTYWTIIIFYLLGMERGSKWGKLRLKPRLHTVSKSWHLLSHRQVYFLKMFMDGWNCFIFIQIISSIDSKGCVSNSIFMHKLINLRKINKPWDSNNFDFIKYMHIWYSGQFNLNEKIT